MERTWNVLTGMCVLLLITLLANVSEARWYTWAPYSDPVAEEFRIYRGTSSLTCEEEQWTFPVTHTQYYIDDPLQDGTYFMSLVALRTLLGAEILSGHSNEIMVKICDGQLCDSYFDIIPGNGYVYLDFEVYDSVSGFQVRYIKEGDAQETIIDNITGPFFIYDLSDGRYTFTIYAKDAQGRTIENGNSYPTLVRDVLYDPTPHPPMYGVESLGVADTQTLVIGFEKNDDNVQYFNVNVYSSSTLRDEALTSNTPGDIYANVMVPYGSNFCGSINGTVYPIVFLRATAVGYNGYESLQAVSYRLMGDIIGTMYDSTESNDAIVDATDRAALYAEYKKYSIQPYPVRSTDFCSEPDLYNMMPFYVHEVSDYNQDGFVGTWDYYYLMRVIYGSSGAGK